MTVSEGIERGTKTTYNDKRQQRGKVIIQRGNQIHLVDEYVYKVKSQTMDSDYDVLWTSIGWVCSCPDYNFRGVTCKHIYAIFFVLNGERVEEEEPV